MFRVSTLGFSVLNKLLQRLKEECLNLIILKNSEAIFKSSDEGMQPLLEAIQSINISGLEGTIVVDKIVGKAAALLISYFKAKKVYSEVMSLRAEKVLIKHRIKYYSELMLPEISNKLGTGICPFEEAVLYVDDPKEGYECISKKMADK